MSKRNDNRELFYTRTFNAPRERVWDAWTRPELFGRWWGPKIFSVPLVKTDLREGGSYLWCMRSPEGRDFCNTGEFREIVPPERIVFSQKFADTGGRVLPAAEFGLPGDWPPEILVTVRFGTKGKKTIMTVTESGIPEEMRGPASAGMNESLDKLAGVVEEDLVSTAGESDSVDEFVARKVLPEFQPVVAMLRELMREEAPGAKEVIAYGIPAYKGKKLIAVINPTKNYVTFGFGRGAEFEDRYELLQGEGHVSKHVKIKKTRDIDRNVLRYYIQQAVRLDEESAKN
ncbi:uncharacterized protein YndB with AHSA1/START domain [Methanolinea mesophila]|uniref:SRPBCC domain-containing protein n=1 Tax=Methanolinea mesophila TaxID=547055 RepID=UPI001AE9A542|nr:SRPBCC domain-containing protein [Methanolinea mesophila]MBP1929460.1 uncharacterized protein YndB with AHSA1/START domain [Methanolinea mesophila]